MTSINEIIAKYGIGDEDAEALQALSGLSSDQEWQYENDNMRKAIVGSVVPRALKRWLSKNEDYKGQQVFLGKRAQFADMNRKFWKLKSVMWDDQPAAFEQEVELLEDMFGHIVMALYFYDPEGYGMEAESALDVQEFLRTKPYNRADYLDALQKMLNRMAVSEHKYGKLEDNYPDAFSAYENGLNRLAKYRQTGNTEFLLDAANFFVIEHLFPSLEGAHFRATDSDESPGLV